MMTIAQIAAATAAGTLPMLSDREMTDASYSVQFAIDPAWMGDEPHLRCEVDACGIGEDGLLALDSAVWHELARREEQRIERDWRQGPAALPLAA